MRVRVRMHVCALRYTASLDVPICDHGGFTNPGLLVSPEMSRCRRGHVGSWDERHTPHPTSQSRAPTGGRGPVPATVTRVSSAGSSAKTRETRRTCFTSVRFRRAGRRVWPSGSSFRPDDPANLPAGSLVFVPLSPPGSLLWTEDCGLAGLSVRSLQRPVFCVFPINNHHQTPSKCIQGSVWRSSAGPGACDKQFPLVSAEWELGGRVTSSRYTDVTFGTCRSREGTLREERKPVDATVMQMDNKLPSRKGRNRRLSPDVGFLPLKHDRLDSGDRMCSQKGVRGLRPGQEGK